MGRPDFQKKCIFGISAKKKIVSSVPTRKAKGRAEVSFTKKVKK
jgi:hypothetical protein